MDLATVGLRVDGGQALQTMDRFTESAGKAAKQGDNVEKMARQLQNTLRGMGAAFGIREVIQYADSWQLVQARIDRFTKSNGEAIVVQRELFKVAQSTRQQYGATAELYLRIVRNAENLARSQRDIIRVTEIVNKALVTGGVSAREAAAGTYQFGQALASGKLSGDEFRSMMENMTELSLVLAEGLEDTNGEIGVTIGRLMEMSKAGQLTPNQVIDALLRMGATVDKEFGDMPITIGHSFNYVSNAVAKFIGEGSELNGSVNLIGRSFMTLADNINTVANVTAALAITYAGRWMTNHANAIKEVIEQRVAEQAAAVNALRAKKVEALANLDIVRTEHAIATSKLATAQASRAAAVAQGADVIKLIALDRQLAAATAAAAASQQALTAAQRTAMGASVALATATSAHTRIMMTATAAARGMWAAIGGPIGAVLLGLWAVYEVFQHIARKKKEIAETEDVKGVDLSKVDPAAVARAEAEERKKAAEAARDQRNAIADMVREAQQGLAIAKLEGLEQEKARINYDAINKRIEAQREHKGDVLNETLAAIEAERRYGIAAAVAADNLKRAAEARKENLASEDMVRAAEQAASLAGLQGQALARARLEMEAGNKVLEAQRTLSGEVLTKRLNAIEAEKQWGIKAIENAAALEAQNKAADEAKKRIKEQMQELERFAENLQEKMGDVFYNIFNKGLNSFKDLVDGIKQLFFRMLADMAAAATMKKFGATLTGALAGIMGVGATAAGATPPGVQSDGSPTPVVLEGITVTAGKSLGAQIVSALAAAGAGAAAGFMVGGLTRNRGLGAVGGAAAGAATGFAVAGPMGALVGGLSGLVTGFLGASKAAKAHREELQKIADMRRVFENNLRVRELEAKGLSDEAEMMALVGKHREELIQAMRDTNLTEEQRTRLMRVQHAEQQALIEMQAKRAEQEKKQREEEARRLEQERQAFIDNLQVRRLMVAGLEQEAADLEFVVRQQGELNAALEKWGETNPELVLQLGELQQAERDYRAEQMRLAEVAFRQDLALRRLRALGMEEEARELELLLAQRREMAEARGAGMSGAALAELEQVHYLERLAAEAERAREARAQEIQRLEAALAAVKDGINQQIKTIERQAKDADKALREQAAAIRDQARALDRNLKAQIDAIQLAGKKADIAYRDQIDATKKNNKITEDGFKAQIDRVEEQRSVLDRFLSMQMDIAKEQLTVARDQLKEAERNVDQTRKVASSLRDYLDGLRLDPQLSTGNPYTIYAEAQRQFGSLLAGAMGGDQASAQKLPQAASELLEAARVMFASGPEYVRVFNEVHAAVAQVAQQYETMATAQEQELELMREQVAGLERVIAVIETARDAELAALREGMTLASETELRTAGEQLVALTEQGMALEAARQEAAETGARQVEALEAAREAAKADAARQVEVLNARRQDAREQLDAQLADNELLREMIAADAVARVEALNAELAVLEKGYQDQIAVIRETTSQAERTLQHEQARLRDQLQRESGHIVANGSADARYLATFIADQINATTRVRQVTEEVSGRVGSMISLLEQIRDKVNQPPVVNVPPIDINPWQLPPFDFGGLFGGGELIGGIPGFAHGGRHRGGIRLVGERGPELEVTGPSSILSNANLTKLLGEKEESLEEQREQSRNLRALLRAQMDTGLVLESRLQDLTNQVEELRSDTRLSRSDAP